MGIAIGRARWAIAAAWIPKASQWQEPETTSHETECLLDMGDDDADVTMTIDFSDREPADPHRELRPNRRAAHAPRSRQAENALITTVAFPAE